MSAIASPAPVQYEYEVFLLYAAADGDWVSTYLLPRLGLPPERVIAADQFRPGEARVAELERAVIFSRFTLLVWSRAFQASPWASFGETLATHLSVKLDRKNVITLRCDPGVSVPNRLDTNQWLDCCTPQTCEKSVASLRSTFQLPERKWRKKPCPYPGMQPFTNGGATSFFGREKEIRDLTAKVQNQSLVVLIGDSGCGKSSLVSAGLVPQLAVSTDADWVVRTMRPGAEPLKALDREIPCPDACPETDWARRAGSLISGAGGDARLLLVVDQFEELFAQTSSESDRNEFFSALNALRGTNGVALLLLLRADFYGFTLGWPLGPMEVERLDLARLSGDELRRAIVEPAKANNVYIEPQLIDRLLDDCGTEKGALPLLQESLASLWSQVDSPYLSLDAYLKMGGLQNAINRSGDAAIASLTDKQQRFIAWRILLRLVQFGDGERADTRRRQPVESLCSAVEDERDFVRVLDQLAKHRIVVLSNPAPKDRYVDLSHEALIEHWIGFAKKIKDRRVAEVERRRLNDRVDEWVRLGRDRNGLLDDFQVAAASRWLASPDAEEVGFSADLPKVIAASQPDRRRLSGKAEEWVRLGRGPAALLDETELADAKQWMAGSNAVELGIPPDLVALCGDSRRELDRKTRVRKRAISGAGALLLLVVATLCYAWAARDERLSTRGSLDAASLLVDDDRGNNLAALSTAISAAQRFWSTTESIDVLQEAVQRVSQVPDMGPIFDLAVVAGHLPVFAGTNGVAAFDPNTGSKTLLETGAFYCVAISAGGNIAAGARGGTIMLWDKEGAMVTPIPSSGAEVTTLAFSPDGRKLAAGLQDGRIKLWNTSDYSPLPFDGRHEDMVNRVVFSPYDPKLLASASADGITRPPAQGHPDHTARLWDVVSNKSLAIFTGHRGPVTGVVFEPDQRHLTTVASDGVIRRWDMAGKTTPQAIPVRRYVDLERIPAAGLSSAILNAQGQILVGYASEGKVELWDLDHGVLLHEFRGMRGRINATALYGSNSETVLLTAEDNRDAGTIRIFPLNKKQLLNRAVKLLPDMRRQ